MEDYQIIALLFARDERALTEIHTKYGRLLSQLAGNILDVPQDVEECLSDAYLAVWNAVPPNRPNNLMAYLCKIVRNLAITRRRRQYAAKRSVRAEVPLADLEEYLPDETASEEHDRELGEALSSFLSAEKADARNVFLRRYWFCDSVPEIAARYGFSESKVKSMLFHTRKRLAHYLKKEGLLP